MVIDWNDLFVFDSESGCLAHNPERKTFLSERSKRSWQSFSGKNAGFKHKAKRSKTDYFAVKAFGKTYKAHRVIWEMHFGSIEDGLQIDHIDGNGLNNRLSNLRVVSQSDNQRNRGLQSNNTSGIKGVTKETKTGGFIVRINDGSKRKYLGFFRDYFDACCARKSAEVKYGYLEVIS